MQPLDFQSFASIASIPWLGLYLYFLGIYNFGSTRALQYLGNVYVSTMPQIRNLGRK